MRYVNILNASTGLIHVPKTTGNCILCYHGFHSSISERVSFNSPIIGIWDINGVERTCRYTWVEFCSLTRQGRILTDLIVVSISELSVTNMWRKQPSGGDMLLAGMTGEKTVGTFSVSEWVKATVVTYCNLLNEVFGPC